MRCLLIETNDKRRFFTSIKNLHALKEFSNTFNIKIYKVETNKDCIISLKEFSSAFCNQSYEENKEINYKIIELIK